MGRAADSTLSQIKGRHSRDESQAGLRLVGRDNYGPAFYVIRELPIGVFAMLTNRSAPPATVTPVLAYADVRAAVAWLEAAFGFEERVRIGDTHRWQAGESWVG